MSYIGYLQFYHFLINKLTNYHIRNRSILTGCKTEHYTILHLARSEWKKKTNTINHKASYTIESSENESVHVAAALHAHSIVLWIWGIICFLSDTINHSHLRLWLYHTRAFGRSRVCSKLRVHVVKMVRSRKWSSYSAIILNVATERTSRARWIGNVFYCFSDTWK